MVFYQSRRLRITPAQMTIPFIIWLAVCASCGTKESDKSAKTTRPVSELNSIETEEHFNAADWTETRGSFLENKAAPFLEGDAANGTFERKPVIIYYAVDGEEPFMQAATDYSVRSLHSACKAGVNWITFVNSLYVYNSETYLTCVDGIYNEQKLNGYFDKVIEVISAPGTNPQRPENYHLTYKLAHDAKFNAFFGKASTMKNKKNERYPLAHPEVFALALEKTREIFNPKEHVFFLHSYSHGAEEFILTGLTEKQLKKKVARQDDVVKKELDAIGQRALDDNNPINASTRNAVACEAKGARWDGRACFCPTTDSFINQFYGVCGANIGFAGLGNAPVGELSLDTLGLGPQAGIQGNNSQGVGSQGVGSQGVGSQGVGSQGVGSQGIGFDDVEDDGLGAVGVGVRNHFGSNHQVYFEVLRDAGKQDMLFAHLFLEACNTKIEENMAVRDFIQSEVKNLGSLYSAKGNMWYRNLDWDIILDNSKNAAQPSRAILDMLTVLEKEKLKNFESKKSKTKKNRN